MAVETSAPTEGAGPPGQAPKARWTRRRRLVAALAIGCALALVLGIILFGGVGTGSKNTSGAASSGGSGTTQVASGLGLAAAKLLDLNVFPGSNGFAAPDFTLTDQYGKAVSLHDFRGKVVVLSFNDDRCPDLCTLLAQDIVVANRDLGSAARHVVFLSVNVNPFYPGVATVKSWTDSHGLGNQPNWIFTTGTVPKLEAVWKKYGTTVQLDQASRTVTHSTQLYFIDPQGQARAVGTFGTNAANTSLYAHDMAQMAADLLPASERQPVAGPPTPAPTATNVAVGAQAPLFTLPALGQGGQTISLAGLRGRYVVLNFWASTCTACVQEMPHIEKAFQEMGKKVDFVGIAVSDSTSAASAFARRVGVTYPLASDSSGSVAGSYRISGLPYTVIVGPSGAVQIRHPGTFTTEQLVYILQSLVPSKG